MSKRNGQSEYWDGHGGEHWTAFLQRYDELLGEFGHAAIDRADPQPGARYADIGCGTGATTFELGRRVGSNGFVTGIDLSGPMLEAARQRATEERLTHVRFAKADAARYRFEPSSLDGIVSRFGVMFFDKPVDAFAHLRGALRPGGRLVFVCWQEALANEWITVPAGAIIQHLPMPQLRTMRGPGLFSMADAEVSRSILDGYKIHAVVDVATELPVAWRVETARDAESPMVPGLLDLVRSRGFEPSVAILDRGYDVTPVYEACEDRGIRPIIPLRETISVKAGKAASPKCDHGTWTFAGSDAKRRASKWRCPTGECSPASVWVKADRLHTSVPRSTQRWKDTYRQRGCVERGFGRLKNEWGMLPLRVRRIERVRLHVDLTILAQLVTALERARSVPLAA
jgi:SAM-dependent methyltransferase